MGLGEQGGEQIDKRIKFLRLRQSIQLVRNACADIGDGGNAFGDGVFLAVEEVFASGDTELWRGDFDAVQLGKVGAVGDVFIVRGVVEEGRDEIKGVIVPEVGAEIADEAVGDGMVVAYSDISVGADYILNYATITAA